MKDTHKLELRKILNEDFGSIIEREKSSFDELTSPFNSSLVLFGAGGLGQKTLAGLRLKGIEPLAFSDNNPSLWGSTIDGIPVLSPESAAKRFGDKAAFVVTIWRAGGEHRYVNTRKQLLDLHCTKVVSFGFLYWKFDDVFLPYYALGLPHTLRSQSDLIERAFDLWHDDASRSEYLSQLRFRFALDFDNLPQPVEHDQYFPDDLFSLKNDEVFVDCGAYDGDTLKVLLEGHLPNYKGQIIALEPDPANLVKLRGYVETLRSDLQDRVRIVPKAVGARRETVCFSATGTESAVVEPSGPVSVDCVALDEILQGLDPTIIKMDIEGAEPDALTGAKNIIQKAKPVLAISVYHRPDHLWQIPLMIRSLSADYNLFLRPHNAEGWDLVCYAIPDNRLIMV